MSGLASSPVTLTALNTTYNDVTTSANSQDITVHSNTRVWFGGSISAASSPGLLRFYLQGKNGANYFPVRIGFISKFVFSAAAVTAQPDFYVYMDVPPLTFRIRAEAATDASNTYTISNAFVVLQQL